LVLEVSGHIKGVHEVTKVNIFSGCTLGLTDLTRVNTHNSKGINEFVMVIGKTGIEEDGDDSGRYAGLSFL